MQFSEIRLSYDLKIKVETLRGILIVNAVVFILFITVKQISFLVSLDPYQILGPTSSRLANPGEFTLAREVVFQNVP